jgi:hypothetical protein
VSQLKSLLFWRLGRLSYDVALVSTFFRNNRNSFHSASFFVTKDKLSVEFLFLAPTGAAAAACDFFLSKTKHESGVVEQKWGAEGGGESETVQNKLYYFFSTSPRPSTNETSAEVLISSTLFNLLSPQALRQHPPRQLC